MSVDKKLAGAVAFHNSIAGKWDGHYQAQTFRSRLNFLRSALSVADLHGRQWLDAGCGSGALSRWLAESGAEVIGVDAAPTMVQCAAELAVATPATRGIRFEIANVNSLPFPDAEFDGVVCSSVLEYVSAPHKLVDELSRVLRPGGILVISVPNAWSVERMLLRASFRVTGLIGSARPGYMRYSRHQFSAREFVHLLSSHGFVTEQTAVVGSKVPGWLGSRRAVGRLLMFRACKAKG